MRRTVAIFAVLALGLPLLSIAWLPPEAGAITMPPLILPHNGSVVLNNFTGMQMTNLSVNETGAASLRDAGRVWGPGVQLASMDVYMLEGSVAAGPNDRFVAAWTEHVGPGSLYNTFFQIFDIKGNTVVEKTPVSATPTRRGGEAVAVGPDGGFMVGWFDMRSGWYAVFGQRFDKDGKKLGSEMNMSSEPTNKAWLRMASNSRGDYILAWQEDRGGNNHIYARMFDRNGGSLRDDIQVIGGSDGQGNPAVAVDSQDRFAVAWANFGGGSTCTTVMFQRFDASGEKLGTPAAPATADYPRYSPFLAYDPQDNLVLVWNDYHLRGKYNYDIFAQRFDAAGNRVGAEMTLVTGDGMQTTDAFAIDSRGQMLVGWSDNTTGAYQVYAWLFDRDGRMLSKSVVAPSAPYSNETCQAMACSASDHFMVMWYERTYFGNHTSYDLFARPYLQTSLLSGSLTTGVQSPPANLWRWDSLSADIRYGSTPSSSVTFEYSVDAGANWTTVPANNSLAAAGVSPLTIRAKFSSLDNLTTPVLRGITLRYKYNTAPLVRLPADMTVKKNANVTVVSNVTDPDLFDIFAVTYKWTQTAGKNLTLTNATGQNLSFKADKAGTFTFRLVVSDAFNESAPATVTVKVAETKPPAKSGFEWALVLGAAFAVAVLVRRRRP